jgi:hypothetical protein
MAKRTTKTDPKKKGTAKKKGTLSAAQKKLLDTQQISDARARAVAKGKMTWNEARKQQRAQDSTTMVTRTKVGKKVRSSSENLPSKRKYTKAKHKRDNKGNIVAY